MTLVQAAKKVGKTPDIVAKEGKTPDTYVGYQPSPGYARVTAYAEVIFGETK